jgi:plastocyanin
MFSKKIIPFIIAAALLTSRAESQQQQSVTVIELSAMPGLKFNISRFTVKPGTQVKIVYTNTDDMSHNLLITKPGTRLDVVNQALKLDENGPAMNFIPKSSQVLWSIPVLSPNQTKTLTFTAPKQAGARIRGMGLPCMAQCMFLLMAKCPILKLTLTYRLR